MKYSQAAVELGNVKAWWAALGPQAQSRKEAVDQLVDRTETVLMREHSQWVKKMAEATTELRAQLIRAHRESTEMETRRDALRSEVVALEARREAVDSSLEHVDRQVDEAQKRLEASKGITDRAEQLSKRGLGEEELTRLYDLLGDAAAAQGHQPFRL